MMFFSVSKYSVRVRKYVRLSQCGTLRHRVSVHACYSRYISCFYIWTCVGMYVHNCTLIPRANEVRACVYRAFAENPVAHEAHTVHIVLVHLCM